MKIKNAGKGKLFEKIPRKLRGIWVSKMRKTSLYKYCYKSYWYYLLHRSKMVEGNDLYLAAKPNPGAGIGHQIANWIAGYWFAQQFGVKFAHIPFAEKKWEDFLGFYQGEITLSELKNEGYKIVRIQDFDENNKEEYNRIEQIIASYKGQKVVFLAEQDQFYQKQYGVMQEIQKKFYSAPERKKDKLIFDEKSFNIALHVRRGDIIENHRKFNENIAMRYQGNNYFRQALESALEYLKEKKNIQIYLFSQGEEKDFPEFSDICNLHFCLDMGVQDSFLHMVYADALITSKSSFSYKPALLNKGVKFCPANFWHGYPNDKKWILLNEGGKVLENETNS